MNTIHLKFPMASFHPCLYKRNLVQYKHRLRRKEMKKNQQEEEEKKRSFSFGFLRKEKMSGKQKQQEEEEKMKKMREEMMKEMKEEEEERMKKMKEEMKEEMMKEMKKMKEEEGEEERMKKIKMKEEMMKMEEEIKKMKEEEERMKKMKKEMKEEMKKMKEEEDSVWGNFIPSIYFEIIAKSSLSSLSPSTSTMPATHLGGFSSKKELCCSLFDKPILIDGDSKSFGIEKRSGKICFMLGARALSIEWGSTPTYWTWRPSNESRFPEVANLLKVSWLAITGKVETQMLSPKTMYGAYFVIKIAEQNYGLDRLPVQFSMSFVRGDGECSEARKVFLKRREMQQQQGEFPHERGDGWMEIEMGEFFNDGEEDGEVEMHLFETDSHWKCGLIVQGMELRPKWLHRNIHEYPIYPSFHSEVLSLYH